MIFNFFVYKNFYFQHILNTNFTITIFVLFLYAGLLKSISVKILLDIKKDKFSFSKYYKKFRIQSFIPRVNALTENKIIIRKGRNFLVTKKALKIKKYLRVVQNLLSVKFSG